MIFGPGPIERYLKKNGLLETEEVKLALSHKSAGKSHYENLEFLGDAVLGLVISNYLYRNSKDTDVGTLSRTKGYLVSKEVLYRIGSKNELARHMKHGTTLKVKEVKNNKKIISDVVESLTGAVYILKGYAEAEKFILDIYGGILKETRSKKHFGDFKSELQIRVLDRHSNVLPVYSVVKTEGQEHSKVFHVEVSVNGAPAGKGKGKTIKEAEQQAAKIALAKFK